MDRKAAKEFLHIQVWLAFPAREPRGWTGAGR